MRLEKWDDSKVGFRGSNSSGGGIVLFYQAHFGRTVLPRWPLWAHLFYSVVDSVSEIRRACFLVVY